MCGLCRLAAASRQMGCLTIRHPKYDGLLIGVVFSHTFEGLYRLASDVAAKWDLSIDPSQVVEAVEDLLVPSDEN